MICITKTVNIAGTITLLTATNYLQILKADTVNLLLLLFSAI